MVKKADLENLMRFWFEKGEDEKCDALFQWAQLDFESCIKNNLMRRYGSSRAFDQALREVGELRKYERTEDTGEYYHEVIPKIFDDICASRFRDKAEEKLNQLELEDKKVAFLLYKDGELLETQKIYEPKRSLEKAFRIFYDEDFAAPEKLFAVGLVNEDFSYWRAPSYALDIWNSLPEFIDIDEFKIERIKLPEPVEVKRPEITAEPGKVPLPGLGFKGKELEESIRRYLWTLPDVVRGAHEPEEELKGVHFDAWVETKEKYIVAECKGEQVSAEHVREFSARVAKLREESHLPVESWMVTTIGFTPGASEECQFWKIQMKKGRELLKWLLAKGLIKIDMDEKGDPFISRDRGVYVEVSEEEVHDP